MKCHDCDESFKRDELYAIIPEGYEASILVCNDCINEGYEMLDFRNAEAIKH